MLVGSGALLAGKVFGFGIFNFLSRGPKVVRKFENFQIAEDDKELVISNQKGKEIFIIEKGS